MNTIPISTSVIERAQFTPGAATPLQIDLGNSQRTKIIVHNRSNSASSVLLVGVPADTVVDLTYMTTTGNVDAELAPGDTFIDEAGYGVEYWVVGKTGSANVCVREDV